MTSTVHTVNMVKSLLVGLIAAGFSAVLHFPAGLEILWCALVSFVAAAFGITMV